MEILLPVLAGYLTQLPLLIVFVIGLALSFAYRDRHPAAARLALIAFIVLLVSLLIGTLVTTTAPLMFIHRGFTVSQLGILMGAVGFMRSLAGAVAFGLLIAAVFIGRGERPTHQTR